MQKPLKAIDIVDHLTIIAIIGVAACAVIYFLFFQWLAYQDIWLLAQAYEALQGVIDPAPGHGLAHGLADLIAPGITAQDLVAQGLIEPPPLDFRRVLPAMLSVTVFMYAVYRAVPILEDFWGLKRSRINTDHPLCVYIAIGLWLFFINSIMIAFGHQLEFGASFPGILENFFGRYGNDTPHYIAIAQRWYQYTDCSHQRVIVFFPLYAVLIRIMYFVSPSDMFAAWFVSNAFAFASGVMFYKLAGLLTSEKEARLAVKFLFILPSAFFLFVPLTESLFLFLSAAVIYYTLKEKYVHVFIFGLLAALTRSAGVLLIIPVACEIIRQVVDAYRAECGEYCDAVESADIKEIADSDESHRSFAQWITKKELSRFICLTSFLLGIGIYLLINLIVYGSATQFMIYQEEYWGQTLYFFWHTITYLVDSVLNSGREWVIGLAFPGVIAFSLALVMTAIGAKKIRVSLTLYAMAYFIFAFGPTWLMSGPRYAAVLFPIALVAAKIAGMKKGYNLVLTIAYLTMFALYFHEFMRDNFVF